MPPHGALGGRVHQDPGQSPRRPLASEEGSMTYTYAILPISLPAYAEIKRKLEEAGYEHAIGPEGELDMRGIALALEEGGGG